MIRGAIDAEHENGGRSPFYSPSIAPILGIRSLREINQARRPDKNPITGEIAGEVINNDFRKKLNANIRNSKLSTGPKDTSITRYNAVKHGITSKQVVVTQIDGIDAAERFDQTLAGLRKDFSPQGVLEESLLEQIAVGMHLQYRLLAYENAVISRRVENLLLKRNLLFKQDLPSADLILAENALARLEGKEQLSHLGDATCFNQFIRERLGHSGRLPLGDFSETQSAAD